MSTSKDILEAPHEVDKRFVEERELNTKALWPAHHEMLRRIALGQGNVSIAEAIGCTPQTVSNVRNSPMGREKLSRLKGEMDAEVISIAQRIEEFAPQALQVLESIITGELEAPIGLVARTAENYMGRAGYGTLHKVHAVHQRLSREEIEGIKERARSAAERAGVIASRGASVQEAEFRVVQEESFE